MEPLNVCAHVIPSASNLLEVGNSFVSKIFATVTTTIVIAVAWFAYRPLFSLILLVLLAIGFWLINKRVRSKNQPEYEMIDVEAQPTLDKADDHKEPEEKFRDLSGRDPSNERVSNPCCNQRGKRTRLVVTLGDAGWILIEHELSTVRSCVDIHICPGHDYGHSPINVYFHAYGRISYIFSRISWIKISQDRI